MSSTKKNTIIMNKFLSIVRIKRAIIVRHGQLTFSTHAAFRGEVANGRLEPHMSLNDELNSTHIEPVDLNIDSNESEEGSASSTVENFEIDPLAGRVAVALEDSGTMNVELEPAVESHIKGLYSPNENQRTNKYLDPTLLRQVEEDSFHTHQSVRPNAYPTDNQKIP